MKSHLSLNIAVVSFLILNGCAGSTFSVKSDPMQAEVFIENNKTGEKKSIGVTPLDIPLATVKETAGEEVMAGEYFTEVIEKKGYLSQKLNIPATRFGTMITQLDVPLKAGDQPKQIHVAGEILDHLFVAQKMALSKEYERAQVEIDKVLSISPDFARAFSMRGSIYFIQKNYNESLKWYEEALKADSKMEEAIKMIARIKSVQSGKPQDTARLPAANGGKK